MSLARSDIREVENDGASVRMLAYAFLAASLLLNTRAPAELVVLYAIACVVPAVSGYVQSVRKRNGDQDPTWMKAGAASRPERREFRQRLIRNPFASGDPASPIGDRITDAAELCVQYGRKAIVLTLTFEGVSPDELSTVAGVAQQIVRKTDLVEMVSPNEIVIGLAMVHDFSVAGLVMNRLRGALGSRAGDMSARIFSGAAIYPLHGYTGEELISSARRNLQAWAPPLAA
jgi:hypothetical protein